MTLLLSARVVEERDFSFIESQLTKEQTIKSFKKRPNYHVANASFGLHLKKKKKDETKRNERRQAE